METCKQDGAHLVMEEDPATVTALTDVYAQLGTKLWLGIERSQFVPDGRSLAVSQI